MTEPKTTRTDQRVDQFLAGVAGEAKRADCDTLCRLMTEATGEPPAMWGPSIVGFGSLHYRYASGREGDWPLIGFSPRKQNLTLYVTDGFDNYQALLARLGKHKTGKACLYVKRLSDVDLNVLTDLINQSVRHQQAGSGS